MNDDPLSDDDLIRAALDGMAVIRQAFDQIEAAISAGHPVEASGWNEFLTDEFENLGTNVGLLAAGEFNAKIKRPEPPEPAE